MVTQIRKLETAIRAVGVIRNWPLFFADWLGIVGDRRIVYALRNGVSYIVRPGAGDRGPLTEVCVYRFYTPEGFQIGETDTVLDIGAHIGLFSVLAARTATKGRVYAFEPSNDNFELLKHNIDANHIVNVTPLNAAMSSETGEKELFLSEVNSGSNSFHVPSSRKAVVPTVSLKDFLEQNSIQRVDFLKMDCEGSEYDILLACPDDVVGRITRISMEWHNLDANRNVHTLKNWLERKGFTVRLRSDNATMLYAHRSSQTTATTQRPTAKALYLQ